MGPSTNRAQPRGAALDEIVGQGHNFTTVKPLLNLFKIMQLWCPPSGWYSILMQGPGPRAMQCWTLIVEAGTDRRFILIEQGRPENGDKYARSLTWRRLHNVITGQRPGPTEACQRSRTAGRWNLSFDRLPRTDRCENGALDEKGRAGRRSHHVALGMEPSRQLESDAYRGSEICVPGRDGRSQGEGYFIIWNNGGPVGELDRDSYRLVLKDAEKAGLKPPYHVYARYEVGLPISQRAFLENPDKSWRTWASMRTVTASTRAKTTRRPNEPFRFQSDASEQIAGRFCEYMRTH